ncbi:nicotinamide-nucleotide adenylyltransferase, partial [mine drainage metagenome]
RAAAPDTPLLVAIGTAEESYTWRNPFTAGERFEMIDRAARAANLSGVEIVPLPDIRRHAQWVAYAESMLPPFERVYSNNPLTRLLFERAGYAVEAPPLRDRARFEGAQIRARLAEDRGWRPLVPPATADYLGSIGAPARLRLLRPAGAPGPDDHSP